MIESPATPKGDSLAAQRNLPPQRQQAIDLTTNSAASTRDAEENLKNFKTNYMDRSDIKPTRKRYLILLLFSLHSAINSLQWIYLSSITNSVAKFYQVDNLAINLTSTIYMIVYIPLVVPATWLFERFGMRNSILIGSLGTTCGSLIKCFSCQPGSFWTFLIVGQTLVAISQLFILSVPPRLASVWFPDHQVSLANACGVFGNQLGIALGFIVPQLIIGNEMENVERIGSGLLTMFIGITICSSLISLLIGLFFDKTPARPPGLARLQQIIQENAIAAEAGAQPLVDTQSSTSRFGFAALLWDLACDTNFVLLMASYGLNVGVFYAISTVLNQMLSPIWPDANTLVGRLGLLLVVSGMCGSVIAGYILDKTRMYRLVNASLYTMSLLAMLLFSLTVECRNSVALYLAVILLGYFMTGYLFIGYEMSNEITWPRPESVTAGLLNMSAQVSIVGAICFVAMLTGSHPNVAFDILTHDTPLAQTDFRRHPHLFRLSYRRQSWEFSCQRLFHHWARLWPNYHSDDQNSA